MPSILRSSYLQTKADWTVMHYEWASPYHLSTTLNKAKCNSQITHPAWKHVPCLIQRVQDPPPLQAFANFYYFPGLNLVKFSKLFTVCKTEVQKQTVDHFPLLSHKTHSVTTVIFQMLTRVKNTVKTEWWGERPLCISAAATMKSMENHIKILIIEWQKK